MREWTVRLCVSLGLLSLIVSSSNWRSASGQEPAKAGGDAPKTAAQQFKNIQVLKDIPAEQLIPTMQFITASLGVECDFCHVEHQMDKDDKKEKGFAREMMKMQFAIDKTNFKGDLEVTCYTCHRGSAHPVGTPVLISDPNAKRPAPHRHDDAPEAHPNLPSADQILDKYLAAVGGADALAKIKTRVQKGTIDAMGMQSPIEVYAEAPDRRVSVTHVNGGSSVTAYNGQAGWLSIPGGFHRMSTAERESANIDAQMYFPAKVREMYREFQVRPGEEIDGRQTYLVSAAATPGHPAIRMYFDQESGLLLRLIRYTETALGRNPAQVDYAEYKEANGVKIPYRWTLARPNGAFTIHIDSAQQNVPVDEKLFEAPADNPPPTR
ncbi:MAG TPA: c-type cytochrome [Dongiaceae bacterium]|nr:c-type cytochrome [Dongiaceae bacterium]